MAIPRELGKEQYDAMDTDDKDLYEESGDVYKLITTNVGALRELKSIKLTNGRKHWLNCTS